MPSITSSFAFSCKDDLSAKSLVQGDSKAIALFGVFCSMSATIATEYYLSLNLINDKGPIICVWRCDTFSLRMRSSR